MMQVIVLGAGAWGTALAIHIAKHQGAATLWMRSENLAQSLIASSENQKYLPGVKFPPGLKITSDLAACQISAADLIVFATPLAGLTETVTRVLQHKTTCHNWIWVCKGLDANTARLPHQLMADLLGTTVSDYRLGVLSGPSFAKEVAQGLPCALTVASSSQALIETTQKAFHHANLRIYSSHDVTGVELGGAIKNVLAIATGIADGIGLGLNARAALLTRGLAEMRRLIVACGGDAETAVGLTGLGDLILTATGDLSRNRQVGLALAQGQSLEKILNDLGHVAEGVRCAKAVRELAAQKAVEMPITNMVCEVLFNQLEPRLAVSHLMGRDAKSEGL